MISSLLLLTLIFTSVKSDFFDEREDKNETLHDDEEWMVDRVWQSMLLSAAQVRSTFCQLLIIKCNYCSKSFNPMSNEGFMLARSFEGNTRDRLRWSYCQSAPFFTLKYINFLLLALHPCRELFT